MTERQEILAYWLVPSPGDAARFQSVVDALAAQQDAPRFHPHLSFGSFTGAEPDLGPVLDKLSGLVLTPIEIAETPSFTMSLFARFEPTEQLLRARAALETCPGFRASRDFDPHVSLCYGAPKDRRVLEQEIEALLEAPVVFNRLVAMSITLPVKTHADVALWKHRATHQIPKAI